MSSLTLPEPPYFTAEANITASEHRAVFYVFVGIAEGEASVFVACYLCDTYYTYVSHVYNIVAPVVLVHYLCSPQAY